MTFHKRSLISFLILISCIIFWGCKVNDRSSEGKGHISVQLTDAPAHYDAVYIDIQSIRIKINDTDKNKKANDKGWLTLNDDPVRVNLLDLRNGGTIQLGNEKVGEGMYHQIRLVLGPDNSVVINGESHPLVLPSAQQSGLKLNINARIHDGQTYNLLIDFDAARSIVTTGNGKYILKPVLHSVDLQEISAVSGTIKPAGVQTIVIAIANGDTLSTLTDAGGAFTILGLTKGTYAIAVVPQNDTFAATTQTNVIIKGEDIDLGTIQLEAI